MLGFGIFVHSVKMVPRNLKQALQISVVPALIGSVLCAGLFFVFGIPFEDFDTRTTGLPDGVSAQAFSLFVLSLFIVMMAVIFWIIVSWHRFVLLEEYPQGIIPVFRTDRILAYFGRIVLLMLMAIVVLLPGMLVVGTAMKASSLVGAIFWLVLMAVVWVGFHRFSPVLPGAAIGKPVGFFEAWRATSGANGTLFLVILLALLFQVLMQYLLGFLAVVPFVGTIFAIFAGMLVLPLINVSILTTIYGVFIEKRDLG